MIFLLMNSRGLVGVATGARTMVGLFQRIVLATLQKKKKSETLELTTTTRYTFQVGYQETAGRRCTTIVMSTVVMKQGDLHGDMLAKLLQHLSDLRRGRF